MNVEITPKKISGTIKAIASKSDAHRAIICAALANEKTCIHISESSQDIAATLSCIEAMGATISKNDTEYTITPIIPSKEKVCINCGESGSTLRFLLPVAAALGLNSVFSGTGRLPKRPMTPIIKLLKEHGIVFTDEKLPFEISGKLTPGEFSIEGNISSQFISGLMFALPILNGKSSIRLLSPLESAAYVDMTISVLEKFGVNILKTVNGFDIIPIKKFISPKEYFVECDWSNSAFFIVAAALSGNVRMTGLNLKSCQSDKMILDILQKANVNFSIENNTLSIQKSNINPFDFDVSQCPDLFPVAAILACGAKGSSLLYNAKRLRIKESDRIKTTRELIEGLGGNVHETEDSLTILGTGRLSGGKINSANDHRIAMSAFTASCICDNNVILEDAGAIKKSYPDFMKDFESLGGKYNVI